MYRFIDQYRFYISSGKIMKDDVTIIRASFFVVFDVKLYIFIIY